MQVQVVEHLPFPIIDAARNQVDNFIVTATFLKDFTGV